MPEPFEYYRKLMGGSHKNPLYYIFWKEKSGQPFSTVNFGVLESFFISAANDITENTVDDLELNGR